MPQNDCNTLKVLQPFGAYKSISSASGDTFHIGWTHFRSRCPPANPNLQPVLSKSTGSCIGVEAHASSSDQPTNLLRCISSASASASALCQHTARPGGPLDKTSWKDDCNFGQPLGNLNPTSSLQPARSYLQL